MDFARAKLLMETIVEAGKHGPLYQALAGMAGDELKKMIAAERSAVVPKPAVVTPAAGPANAINVDNPATELVPDAPIQRREI